MANRMMLKSIKTAGALLAGGLRPLARCWARRGYFSVSPATLAAGDRALLVSCNWVGDNFLASQVMPALQERYPQVRWWVLTKPASADLWHGLTAPGRLLTGDAVVSDRRRERFHAHRLFCLASECRACRFDLIVDLTGNRYSAMFCFLCRPRWTLGSEGDELGWVYSMRVEGRRVGRHEAEKPWRVVEPLLGRFDPPRWLQPAAPTCSFDEVCSRLGIVSPNRLAVLAPGGGWAGKCWPPEAFSRLGALLSREGFLVAAVGGPQQSGLCRLAVEGVKNGVCAGGVTVGEALAMLQRADLVVSNDTAEAHLAAAFGRPVVALFGPTNPALCGPIGPRVAIVRADCPHRPEGEQLHCRDMPGAPGCRRCMDTISVQRVMQRAEELLHGKE